MMDKFDYIKIGTIHSSKIPLRAWKDKPKNGKRYMQYINNQAFMSRIYKEHLPISKTKMDHPTEKWANDLNRCFRRRNQSGQNQKVFNWISNQGNASQNYMKNYNTKYWPECGAILICCWQEIKLVQDFQKRIWQNLLKFNICISDDPKILLLGIRMNHMESLICDWSTKKW